MAKLELKNSASVPGPLFVDTTCIDCGTCFHISQDIFLEKNNRSVVQKQPEGIVEWTQAKEAILSCPTTSIGVNHPPGDFKNAPITLPRLITDDIFYCGYTSENSYGASSFLIKTPNGNMLIDSPKFNFHLVKQLEQMGGVRWMFLTHKDDVADHRKFKEHFNCSRIIHRDDLENDTRDCEIILDGSEDRTFTESIKFIMTPGHTRGHMVLYYKNQYLFTGDHLFYDPDANEVYASKSVNWFSWSEQLSSIRKLLDIQVEWIFPGHGGWSHIGAQNFKKSLQNIS